MTTGVIKILLVEDNPGDARLLREAFVEIPESRSELVHCSTLAQALEFLAKSKPDVILSDLGLPDSQGLEAVGRIHDVAPDVPLVVLTALNDDALALQSLQQGAQDYLVKGQIDGNLLWRTLCYAMERQRDGRLQRADHVNCARDSDQFPNLNNFRVGGACEKLIGL